MGELRRRMQAPDRAGGGIPHPSSPDLGVPPPTGGRLAKLRAKLAAHGLDAFLTFSRSNRLYLTGFTGSAGMAVVLPDAAILLVDFRYREQALQQAPGWEVRQVESFHTALKDLFQERGVTRCGFEEEQVTYKAWKQLQEKVPDVRWEPTDAWVEELRGIKGPEELAALKKAMALGDRAFSYILEHLRPGVTEREVAVELEYFLRREGAEALSFPPIVASGPNGALPHARPTERPLQAGDLVILDFGCVVDGYCSDLTRTVCLGPASEEQRGLYQLVLRAQEAGIAAIRPGIGGREVDAVARQIIADAGHGDHFGHGLGHGIGLDIHEEIPRLSKTSEVTLQPGMVSSVEPGVYLPGWGGIRIEDVVVVTEEGCDILTTAPKDFIELPL